MHSFLPILGFTLVSVSAHTIDHQHVKRDLAIDSGLPSAWSSLGCYSDIRTARALTAGYTASSQMTEVMCIEYCDQNGFSYAGVEYGQECYCGFGIENDHQSIDQSSCNMACPGSPSTACGGPDAINIFTNGHAGPVENPGVLNYESLGCYSDSQSARTLNTFKSSSDGITFVRGCIEVCSSAGFQYAGLEYRQECWCGNEILSPGAPIDDSACNMPCNGNSTEQCGGADAINIYQYQAPSTASTTSSASSSTTSTTTPSTTLATTTSTITTADTTTTATTTSATTTMSRTTTTTTTSTSTCAPTIAPVANNLISNPSFETDTTGWSVTGGVSRLDTAEAYDGCNSFMLPGTGSMGFTQTSINVPLNGGLTANQYYTFTFYQGVPAGSTNTQPVISGTIGGQRFGQATACSSCSISGSAGSTWQRLQFRAPAGSSSTVQIVVTYTNGNASPILFDGFSLVQS